MEFEVFFQEVCICSIPAHYADDNSILAAYAHVSRDKC